MANLHAVQMPLSKKPRFLFENMRDWLAEVQNSFDDPTTSEMRESNTADHAALRHIHDMDLNREIDLLEGI